MGVQEHHRNIISRKMGVQNIIILQILSLSLLEKIPISQALSGIDDIEPKDHFRNQLNLFN